MPLPSFSFMGLAFVALAVAQTAPAPSASTAPPAVVPPSTLAFAARSDDAVVDLVMGYFSGLSTLRAGFVQTAPSGAISTGTLWLRRPGQIRFEYDAPAPLLIVATQGNVFVRDTELETTDQYPIKSTPLRFLLAKDLSLEDLSVVAVERGVDTVAVTFKSDDEETEGDLSIILSAPTLALKQWIVRDDRNGVTIVSLEGPVRNEKLDNRLFRAPDAGGKFINN